MSGLETASGSVRIRRGIADQPDATATIDPDLFFALVLGQRPVGDAIASGDLRLVGSPDAARRLIDLLLALVAMAPQALDAVGLWRVAQSSLGIRGFQPGADLFAVFVEGGRRERVAGRG